MTGLSDRQRLDECLARAEAAYKAGRWEEAAREYGEARRLDASCALARERCEELRLKLARPSAPKDGTMTMGGAGQGTMTMGSPGGEPPAGERVAGWTAGETVEGLYEVEEVLGEGGFGSVHKVRHLGWGMDLAVKSPREDKVSNRRAMERFVQEANTWVGLGFHPNVVTCYFVRLIGGIPRIFIEYLEAGTLADWLKRRRIMDAKIAMDVAIQLARGMERVHGRGLVHRDLKPGNCLMAPSGTLKVTDFGLAKAGQEDDAPEQGPEPDSDSKRAKAREASMSGRLGTPEYMAPEQWYQAGKATAAADVWAFGVMLCEIMHTRPFRMADDEPPEAFYFRMLESGWKFKFREDAPGELKGIIASCLSPEPRCREARFDVLRSRLEALYASLFREPYPREPVKQTPLLADTLSNQGVSFADLGRTEDALKLFGAALRQDPTHPGAMYNQGILLYKEGKLTLGDLVSRLEGCKRARPREWAPGYLLGVARLQEWDRREGIRELKEAAALLNNPLIKRAVTFADSGRPESALELFISLPMGAEAAQAEEAQFNGLMAQARKEADAGAPIKAYEILMRARAVKGYARAPLALGLQQRLGVIGERKALRAVWLKLAYEGSRSALAAAISPDGTSALSGHEDGSIGLWDLESGRIRHRRPSGHAGPVQAVAFAADAGRALTAGKDDALKSWDPETGALLSAVACRQRGVSALCVTPDGLHAWTAGEDGTLKRWSLESGREERSVKAHAGPAHALALSPDGRHLLSAGADGGFRLWDAANGRPAGRVRLAVSVLGLDVSAPHACALLACGDGSLRLWRSAMEGRAEPFGGEGHAGTARGVRVLPDGKYALSAGGHKELKLWDLGRGRCVWASSEHTARVNAACVSQDARYAVSAGDDGVLLWEFDWDYGFPERGRMDAAPADSRPIFGAAPGTDSDLEAIPAAGPQPVSAAASARGFGALCRDSLQLWYDHALPLAGISAAVCLLTFGVARLLAPAVRSASGSIQMWAGLAMVAAAFGLDGGFKTLALAAWSREGRAGQAGAGRWARAAFGLVWTWAIKGILLALGFALLVVPGIVAAFRWWFAGTAAAVDGLDGWRALKRSGQLVCADTGNTVLFILSGWVVAWTAVAAWGGLQHATRAGVAPVLGEGPALLFESFMILFGALVASGWARTFEVLLYADCALLAKEGGMSRQSGRGPLKDNLLAFGGALAGLFLFAGILFFAFQDFWGH